MTNYPPSKRRKPLPSPINPVDEFCLPVQIPADRDWMAAFVSAVRKLSNRSTWNYDENGDYIVVADRWREVADEIQRRIAAGVTCEAEICEDGSCTEIGPFHPALSYFPNNPITQPDYDGPYQAPIWGTGAGYIGASGTDAMIDVFAYGTANLIDLLTGAILPSITLDFSGSGEIDVQFIATIQGGAVWGYPDGNPLLGDLVSLEYTDIFSLAGTATLVEFFELTVQADAEAFSLTHSWKFETEGQHTLTLLFFPTAELEPPFIGAGGGLRSVQLCGGAVVDSGEVEPVDIIIDGGKLRATVDDVPVGAGVELGDIADLIDRWVDEAGDTMTGTLIQDLAYTGAGTNIPQQWRRDGDLKGYLALLPDRMILHWMAAYGMRFLGDGEHGADLWLQDNLVRLKTDASYGFAPAGAFRVQTNDVNVGMGLQNVNTDALYTLAGYDDLSMLRWAAGHSGQILAAGYNGWDYTSTATWRQQFGLVGLWDIDTEALRSGGVALTVHDFAGADEVVRADHDTIFAHQPRVAFFGAEGAYPHLYGIFDGTPFDRLVSHLERYGLIESQDYQSLPPEAPDALTAWETCNAAYYVAAQLSALVTDGFDMLASGSVSLSDLVLYYTSAPFEMYVNGAVSVVLALQSQYALASGIAADMADVDSIASSLLAGGFDEGEVYTDLTTSSGFITDTLTLLNSVLAVVWRDNLAQWIAVGKYVEAGACGSYQLPCEDRLYDLRWSNAQGIQIDDGVLTFGVGVKNGFADPYYRVFMQMFFDQCDVTLTVNYHCENTAQGMVFITAQSDGMGGYTDTGTTFKATSMGDNVMTFAPGVPVDLIRVRLESEFTNYENWITSIEVTVN